MPAWESESATLRRVLRDALTGAPCSTRRLAGVPTIPPAVWLVQLTAERGVRLGHNRTNINGPARCCVYEETFGLGLLHLYGLREPIRAETRNTSGPDHSYCDSEFLITSILRNQESTVFFFHTKSAPIHQSAQEFQTEKHYPTNSY